MSTKSIIMWCEHERCHATEARYAVCRERTDESTPPQRVFYVCGRHLVWAVTWATADSPKIRATVANVDRG